MSTSSPPPLPPRPSADPLGPAGASAPSSPAPRPAVTPPPPAPSGPINSLEALFRELVVALQPSGAIPPPPSMPSDVAGDVLKSLVPMNTEQLEILKRAEVERQSRAAKDERDRDFRRIAILVLSALVILLETYRAVNPGPIGTTTIAPVVVPMPTAPPAMPTTIKVEERNTDVARDK